MLIKVSVNFSYVVFSSSRNSGHLVQVLDYKSRSPAFKLLSGSMVNSVFCLSKVNQILGNLWLKVSCFLIVGLQP